MQCPDHGQCERPFSREHLRRAVLAAQDLRHVLLSQTPFFHAEQDCIDRIGLRKYESLGFVIFDEFRQKLEAQTGPGFRCRIAPRQARYLGERRLVLRFRLDDADDHIQFYAARLRESLMPTLKPARPAISTSVSSENSSSLPRIKSETRG